MSMCSYFKQMESFMKKMVVAIVLSALSIQALADTYVQGYCRKDGVCVQSHHRSNADGYEFNNYGTKGNTNPYTGEKGSQDNPYRW